MNGLVESLYPTLGHPNDEDQSLGTPKPQNKYAARMGHPAFAGV
jgi:hypothetical protein